MYPEQIRNLHLLIEELETLREAKDIIENYKAEYWQSKVERSKSKCTKSFWDEIGVCKNIARKPQHAKHVEGHVFIKLFKEVAVFQIYCPLQYVFDFFQVVDCVSGSDCVR